MEVNGAQNISYSLYIYNLGELSL